ncbi:MAG TPA: TolC family protein, partial [Halothiobacillus sp.]|nr:TolC family protein [Halothiobacillus sp.]
LVAIVLMAMPWFAQAQPLTLEEAVEMALNADPRIHEQEANAQAARALIDEVLGHGDVMFEMNAFLGLAPRKSDGFFTNGSNRCVAGQDCVLRDDANKLNGLSPSFGLQASIIKPLYTFGKIENYYTAARYKHAVEESKIKLARGETWLTVQRAWYGYLTARDTRALLDDIKKRLEGAQGYTEEGVDEGRLRLADQFALETAIALVNRFIAQAEGVERIAMDGLKTIIGLPLSQPLELAERHIQPVAHIEHDLDTLLTMALEGRPEMQMAEHGKIAMRAYVEARQAESRPDIYAGVVAMGQYTPGRDRINNPYLFDPLNYAAVTPVLGMRWQFQSGVNRARVGQAEAELQGVIAKAQQAQIGIPFQVAEAYHHANSLKMQVKELREGADAARRWMVSSFLDYEAGIIDASSLADALRTYATTRAEYLSTIFDYNMQIAMLKHAIGDYP